jgi:hypothetical protein
MPLRSVEFHTPLEILTGKNAFKVPSKTFGCVCFVHNTTPGIIKLDVRAHKCVFVGYSRDKKGYRCFDSIKRKMYESMDVTFRESEPYFSSMSVPVGSSTVLTDLLDIASSPYVHTTSEISREGETIQAKESERVEDCELVDPRGELAEPPLAMLDPVDSSTDLGIIPPFEKYYVRTRRIEAKQPQRVEDQYQLPPPVNSSLLPTYSGNTPISDLHLPIAQRRKFPIAQRRKLDCAL